MQSFETGSQVAVRGVAPLGAQLEESGGQVTYSSLHRHVGLIRLQSTRSYE